MDLLYLFPLKPTIIGLFSDLIINFGRMLHYICSWFHNIQVIIADNTISNSVTENMMVVWGCI